MVGLVAVAQALEDLHRLLDAGLLDLHRLETTLKGRILLDVLAVLVVRRRADRLELAARQHRLEHLCRVDRALGGARAHEGVDLVDEQDDVAARADLLEDLLQALLEVAAVARASDQRPHVEAVNLLILNGFGHVAVHDRLGEALNDRGLTDAGFTDQDGVVLRTPGQDLDDATNLVVAPNDRIELAFARHLGQVPTVLGQSLERPSGSGEVIGSGRSWASACVRASAVAPPAVRIRPASVLDAARAMSRCSVEMYWSPALSARSSAS